MSSNTLSNRLLGFKEASRVSLEVAESPAFANARNNGKCCIRITVSLKARASRRCPVCRKRCPGYDSRGATRVWRDLDFLVMRVYLVGPCERVKCPRHGVLYQWAPWARQSLRFTERFETAIAWAACQMTKSAIAEMYGIEWLDNLRLIGIDETGYKRGHKHMTVVVNHETGCIVWIGDKHGAAVLPRFFELMTPEQRESIAAYSADAARWIEEVTKKHCPKAKRCLDNFHLGSRSTG